MEVDEHLPHSRMMIPHSSEAAATLVSLMIIGKYIEDRTRENIKKHAMKAFPNDKLNANQ